MQQETYKVTLANETYLRSKGDHDESEESDKDGAEGQEAEREQASQVYAATRYP